MLGDLKFNNVDDFEHELADWKTAVNKCRCREACENVQCTSTPGPVLGDDLHYLLDQVGWLRKPLNDCAEEVQREVNTLDLERLGPWDDMFYRELLLTAV